MMVTDGTERASWVGVNDVSEVSIIPCPCGERDCMAVFRDGNVYEEGFNFDRRIHNPGNSLAYGKELASHGRLVPTTDDWAPTFPGGLVAVSVHELRDGAWRVSVWGGDDDGMNKDLATKEAADRCFSRLPVYLAKDDLLDLGFRSA